MGTKKLEILPLDPYSSEATKLLSLSDSYMANLYPAESNHMESADSLASSNMVFVGLYADARLIGCGAVKISNDDVTYGEIKRVFVPEQERGQGYSKRIMVHLEEELRTRQIFLARLETGIKQPEALGLYRRLGYLERGPFGKYKEDPLSVFMEKRLPACDSPPLHNNGR